MQIRAIDQQSRAVFEARLLKKAIVPNSLGRLAELAVRLAMIKEGPLKRPIHLLFGADHGITEEGVTHSPREITAQQCRSFAQGGGACSLFSRLGGIGQWVIDVGIDCCFTEEDRIIDHKIRRGTRNFLREEAMTSEECRQAIQIGRSCTERAIAAGHDVIIFGEMGVGNTTSASAITSALLDVDPALVTGKGSGLSDEELEHKVEVIRQALQVHTDRCPLSLLAALGGFEIAAIVGGILAAAEGGVPIIVDGAVVTAAALVACRIEEAAVDYLIFAHRSAMVGHGLAVEALACPAPLLDLGMQLGEGTGALAAWPLVRLASHLLDDLTSFEDAQVTDSTRILQEKGLV
ncbi:MAG: nicotinate-nucleotide--dimethylbenzimidazole phosphoribosyltransferase [Sphaerochaeta sp.]|jgi:nicotinate-nucleotide--dimethylbenzimidazole phosphoribosyltransferase|nr:nicotinate-nucleotide--dimethylbenzimidazole phosphoribosyltransferase [Sphaerochaeta sp.]